MDTSIVKRKLTQQELKRQLTYKPKSGLLIWKVSKNGGVKVGDVAGCMSSDGYVQIGINGKQYFAHQLAWLYIEGYLPEYSIDHKNGIKDDNRWVNLRHVTRTCNMQNQKVNKSNTSGFPGVCKGGIKWTSHIRVNSKAIYLGSYDTPLEAALARLTFEIQCPLWKCNYRSELAKAIKRAWPQFNIQGAM